MNKASKILSIIFYSIILFSGLLTVVFSILIYSGSFNFDPSLTGISLKNILLFSGFLIVIFGILIFLKNEVFAVFFEKVLKKIHSFLKNEEKYYLYAFLALFLFSIIVRIIFINRTLTYQEAFNFINYVARPFFSGALKYDTPNNFVLNSIFASVLNYAFGEKLWAIRIVSFISGVLLCPAIYIMARIYFNKFAALIAFALAAASPILIVYSTTSTGISLFLLIITLFFALAGYLKDRDELIPWTLFVLLSVLGFICSPLFFYPFIIMFLWLEISALLKNSGAVRKLQMKKVLIYSISSLLLSYIFYIPETMKNGLQKILTLNFPQTTSIIMSLKSLIFSFAGSWSDWNVLLPIFLGPVFIITIIIALVFFRKKESLNKFPVITIVFIIFLLLLLAAIKRIDFQNDVFIFVLPILIIIASQGISLIVTKIFSKRINLKSKMNVIFSIMLALIIFSIGFINDFYNLPGKNVSPPEVEKIMISLKEDITADSKIAASQPLDYFFMFYGYKHGVSIEDWSRDLYSSNSFFVFQNKNSNKGSKAIIDEYFQGKTAHIFGFTEPEIAKDFNLVSVYKMKALGASDIPVLNYDIIKSSGTLKKGKINTETQEISLDESLKGTLKILQVPINLEKNTEYLVTFEIKKNGEPDGNVFVDFFGNNYDNASQEFSISPDEINDGYTKIRHVLNSGSIPANTQTFFRIFTKATQQLHVKDIKVSKILDK